MANQFICSLRSEWLKKKRSLGSWMVFIGAFFTPSIMIVARLKNRRTLPALYQADDFWIKLWHQSWESMAVMLLPMGIILAVGLITQLEYKNNTWKQLHTTPQSYATIFFTKLLIVVAMLVQAILLFNLGVYLSGVIPALLIPTLSYPKAQIPFRYFASLDLKYFLDCLPILALQFLVSLQYKNFLVPIGTGIALWILSIGLFSWEYSFIFPHMLCGIDHFHLTGQLKRNIPVNLQLLAAAYFVIFSAIAFSLYANKKEKA